MRLKQSLVAMLALSLALLLPCVAGAQTQSAPEGVTWGDYQVQQSIEFGYRFSNDWQKGNFRTFDNFVNLHEGPRLLENTLSMRSLSHEAPVFDNLFVSTFGFGGDPNNVARVKISKNKWYNFSSQFRRDQNFFDYPQFGNPLNAAVPFVIQPYPATNSLVAAGLAPATAASVTMPQTSDSAHPFATRRRMSDFDLTILPQSIVSVRLGYSRNRITGPSFSSFHEGTDYIIGGNGDNTSTTDNSYRIGVDLKLLPKTTFSFDQTLDYYKNDTNYDLGPGLRFASVPLTAAQTKTGLGAFPSQTFDFGLPFATAPLNRPCGSNTVSFFVNTAGQINPNCSALWITNPLTGLPGYIRYQRTRTSVPSEQFSFVSRAIKNVDLSGRYIYSSADMTSPYTEDYYGAVTRTQERRWGGQGTATAKSINNSAEISGTIHLTDKLRVVEVFRFNAWRTPTFFTLSEFSGVPAVMASGSGVFPGTGGASGFTPFLQLPIIGCVGNTANPLTCNPTAETVFGAHVSGSGADLGTTTTGMFLGQTAKWNTISVEYDFFKSFGARLGYRYGTKRDAEKSGYETGTEYYYPNPAGVGTAASGTSPSYVGPLAAFRGNCAQYRGVAGAPVNAAGICTATLDEPLSEPDFFDVTEHTGLFGLWYRPSHNLRMNGEIELSSFDAAVTRVSPRHQQHYRFRSTWSPSSRATLSFTYNGIENFNPGTVVPQLPSTLVINGVTRNTVPNPNTLDINYKGHNRNFGVSTSFMPSAKVSFDVAYNYNNFEQSNLVCPVYTSLTPSPVGASPIASSVVPNLATCPLFADQVQAGALANSVVNGTVVPSYNLQNGTFTSTNHFVSFFLTLRPVKKFTTQIGYSLSNNNGNMLVMNPWLGVGTPVLNAGTATTGAGAVSYFASPNNYGAPGALASNYHMPSILVSYEVVKNWTAKAQWNYWGYGENTVAQGTGGVSNGFRANAGLISLRYAF